LIQAGANLSRVRPPPPPAELQHLGGQGLSVVPTVVSTVRSLLRPSPKT